MTRILLRPFVAPLFAISLVGCGGRSPSVPDNEATFVVMETGFTLPEVYQSGVGLHARAEGQALLISLHNTTPRPIDVAPLDFAVITGPNPQTDLVIVGPGTVNMRQTVPIFLEPDDKRVMRLQFFDAVPLTGNRLVINNPREQLLFYVEIQ